MKKILFICLLCLIILGCKAQTQVGKYPFFTPIKVYGAFELVEQPAFPSIAVPGDMVRVNDTTWIRDNDETWKPLWPRIESSSSYVPLTRRINNKPLSSDITITATDVGLGNVTNESKATMLNSPALTGTPTAPTAAPGTNTTQVANTAFVQAAVAYAGTGDGTVKSATMSEGRVVMAVGEDSVTTSPAVAITDTSLRLIAQATGETELVVQDAEGNLGPGSQYRAMQFEMTSDTASTGEKYYMMCIPNDLSGWNVLRIELDWQYSAGDKTPSLTAERIRSMTPVTITSSAANFSSAATINAEYDDLAPNDRIRFSLVYGPGTAGANGTTVTITFVKPPASIL